MHRLMISPIEPELSRRAFLFGGGAISMLALTGLGTTTARGFGAAQGVTGYTGSADRFRRAPAGFVRCAANQERLCFNAAGAFIGQYLQGADTYYSAPWDDPAAPHSSGSPAFLTTNAGGTIAYAGAHSEADIFGTTGKGAVITQTATQNGLHTAPNLSPPNIVTGDLLRVHTIVAISGATMVGRIELRMTGAGNFVHRFDHDANGVITGQVEAWSTRRAGFHDMGTINGKRWWYLWVDCRAANATAAAPGIGFGNVTVNVGKKYHICELMAQKNPLTSPAAVPVCKANATFAADTLLTRIASAGYVCDGLAMARSQTVGGNIIPPAINIGVPYEPLETRIEIINSVESADRSGIMPNANQLLYGRTWGTPANWSLTFGPGWFPREWYKGSATGEVATNVTVRSVFQAREDACAILGNMTTSTTYITGALDIDGVILMAGGDTRTKYLEQSDVLTGTGSSFNLNAGGNVSVTNGLAVGATLWPTRARRLIQQDDTGDTQVCMGELSLTSGGGAVSLKGTRTHKMSRTSISGIATGSLLAVDTEQFCATQFWSDMLLFGRGTFTSWTGDQMFGALSTARTDMFLNQSERPVRISTDAGGSWADLSPSFDPATMPHGFLAEHIGTWNFDTATFTSAPDATKSLRVRYWEYTSIPSPAVQKPGFQWVASQMDMGDYTRYPTSGDVFRIKNGSQWIDVTFQGGYWSASSYVRYTSTAANNPAILAAAVSNDFIQINRTDATMTTSNTLDGCVMIGAKGAYFLTGQPGLPANGSSLDNFTVSNTVVMSFGTNALRWDHSRAATSDCTLSNALIIETRSDFTFNDGSQGSLSMGAAGANNILTFGSNVNVLTSQPGGGLAAAGSGASYVNSGNVVTIPIGRRTNFNEFAATHAKVGQYVPAAQYESATGRVLQPTYADLWDFNLTAFADTDAGFGARAVITAAKGTHARWNDKIAAIEAAWHRTPETVATVVNSAAVGTVVAAGVSPAFHLREGGNHEGYFEIVGGELRVARALTGLNRIFMLRGSDDRLMIVDVVTP